MNIYKEPDKKKKKEKNQLLGYIHIPVSDISSRQYVEKWYVFDFIVLQLQKPYDHYHYELRLVIWCDNLVVYFLYVSQVHRKFSCGR